MTEAEILAHEDYQYKQTVDAIQDKKDEDIYVYPSLIPLGEPVEWSDNIMGHSDRTLDLGGQHSPNSVAIKQLIGRGNFLKIRQERIMGDISTLYNKGGLKNLWVDGGMRIWDDGISGDYTDTHNPRYGYGIQIMRAKNTFDDNGNPIDYYFDATGNKVFLTGGTTYHWEKVKELDRNWLKMTHAGAVGAGYIGQRWERDILQYLKGKTVSLSFDYKCGTDMTGNIVFYNEQDIIHDGVGAKMAEQVIDYIGDNQIHRATITVTLSTDNIVPDENSYFGIQIGYGSGADGSGAVPDGSIYFTNIQLEVNDIATDYEHVDLSIDVARRNYFYQREEGIHSVTFYGTTSFCILDYQGIRRIPSVTYLQGTQNAHIATYFSTKKAFVRFDQSASGNSNLTWAIADARIY